MALNSAALPLVFQQALGLPEWTGHPKEETSVTTGQGELAVLT